MPTLNKEKIMMRVLGVLVAFAFVGMASADVVVFQPASDAGEFNASYDNLYRPGNAIWRLRQMRLEAPGSTMPRSESGLLDTGSASVTSSAEVSRPLTVFESDNARSYTLNYFRMSDLMKNSQPAASDEASDNPVFLGVRP